MSTLQWICVVLLVLGQFVPSRAGAQTTRSTTAPSRYDLSSLTIEDVRVLGNTTVSTTQILNLVRTRKGEKFDLATLQQDYQRIYGMRVFQDVQAHHILTDTGIIVDFIVTESKQLSGVTFKGNSQIDAVAIQAVLDLKSGQSLDRFRLATARQAIERLYKEKNFPFAHAELDADALSQKGEALFHITEGPRVEIRNIDFVGATAFGKGKLRDQIQTSTWFPIFRAGTYDPDLLDDDAASLRQFYQQHGYFDARIGRKLIWSPDLTELQINFVIEEGVRYIVDQVSFMGNASLSERQLRDGLKLVEGAAYEDETLQRDLKQLVKTYSPLGFIYQPQSDDRDYLRINVRKNYREAGHVRLIYEIIEGKPFHVGRIIPKGNSKTQDKVILREMRMLPGQLYNSGEVADATERLRGTGYFTRVVATPIGSDPTSRDLLIEVEEGLTARIGFGASVNSNGGIGGNISFEQKNFDINNWPNSWDELFSDRAFTGAGQTFTASFEPGTQYSNAYLRFTEPWIFDQPYTFTGELYARDHVREDYDDTRVGGRLSLGKRFDNIWSGYVSARVEDVNVHHITDPEVRADEILAVAGHNMLTSLGVRILRDTTNRGILPYRGTTTSANFEVVGALGGDFDFQRYVLSHDEYYTVYTDLLDRRTIISLHGDTGYTTEGTPTVERFYGGGIGSIRGFEYRGVTPRSGPAFDRVGGDFMLTGSAEISFPLYQEMLRGVVFADAGTIEPDLRFGTIRASVGFGFRLLLPIPGLNQAPIALDFALPLSKDDQDDKRIFSFSLGFSQ